MVRYNPILDWSDRDIKTNQKGYVLIHVPEHHKSFCGGYYYEHRLVMERQLGRVLRRWETVHHISEDKSDNSPNNLFLCSRREHDYAVWITA